VEIGEGGGNGGGGNVGAKAALLPVATG